MLTPHHQRRKKVLLVEDDSDMRTWLADVFEHAGHEVLTAADGAEAIGCMRSAHPDLVVFDLVMPVMDGWQFRVEQKRDPELATTPVIALSASSTPQARAIDAAAYLRKPVDPATLLRAMDEVLTIQEHREESAQVAQTERMAALGTLAAGLAHEINNPLTYVLLHLGTIGRLLPALRAPGNEDKVDHVEGLLRATLEGAERIRGVTNAIRAFGRVDAMIRMPVDVRAVMDSALPLIANELRHRGRLVKEYSEAPAVLANEGRLAEVFLNLLTNAVQAIPEGDTARNEIRVTTGTDADGNAVVTVADTGSGIPERLLGRIFEPFFSTKPIGQGQGLGLSISHAIVTSFGGTLSVQSEVGRGTVIRVTLPKYTNGSRAVARPADAAAAPSNGRRRVLIIDDEVELARGLAEELDGEHDVVIASSGREAIALLGEDDRFDAILCDLHMPDVSGVELIGRIRAVHRELADRIIVMTAGAFTDPARELIGRGSYATIGKPVDLAELRALIAASASRRDGDASGGDASGGDA